jgi:multidrug transporter EmrE-like cation transporter
MAMNGWPSTLALILASVTLNASAQILLRLGARSGIDVGDRGVAAVVLDVLGRPAVLAGLACYGLSVVTWITVLSRAEASFAYPFLGLGFVLVALAGWLVLGEVPTPSRLAATALIVSGVVLLARS